MDTGFTINQSTENMILPLPVYEQVPLRVALAFEPQSLKEIRRSLISRHMISYNAVQLYLIKCIVDSVGDYLFHITPALVRLCDGITHIASLKYTSYDITK